MMKHRARQRRLQSQNSGKLHPDASFAVGEWMNADPFELALALARYGFRVPEIYGTLSGENFVYVKQLASYKSGDKSLLQPGANDAVL